MLTLHTKPNQKARKEADIDTGNVINSYWTCETYFPEKLFQQNNVYS